MKNEINRPGFKLIGGKILTASDLMAMNEAEVKSRKIPLASEANVEQSHKSKFFAVGLNHRVHIQLCHYPGSSQPDGMFIFLEKEVSRKSGIDYDLKNHMLHPVREKNAIQDIFDSFDSEKAEQYASKLSPRSNF